MPAAEDIAQIYIGYFNRAPDVPGMQFWVNARESGMPLVQIAEWFSVQVESFGLYPYLAERSVANPEPFLNQVYQNLLGRAIDPAGLAFYSSAIEAGRPIGQIIMDIVNGAVTGADAALVEHKTTVALHWVDLAEARPSSDLDSNTMLQARQALDTVTSDPASVAASIARIDAWFDANHPASEQTARSEANLLIEGADVKVTTADLIQTSGFVSNESTLEAHRLLNLDAVRNDARFAGIDGSGVTVAVIDTGVDLDHPAFGADRDFDGVADRIVFQRDFTIEGDGTADDRGGHGTHVASILGSQIQQYPGVAPGVNLVALQVLPSQGTGSGANVEQALQWVVANAEALNIVAVNLSLGRPENFSVVQPEPTFDDELAALTELGVIPVSAAGNHYGNFQTAGASGISADPNTIAVGATYAQNSGEVNYQWRNFQTDESGEIFDYETAPDRFTAFGQRSDVIPTVMAPGAGIFGAAPGGGAASKDGTSMATPFVAGTVALMQQLALRDLGRSLEIDEILNILATSGERIVDGDDEVDSVANTGGSYARLDVLRALEAVLALNPVSDSISDPNDRPDTTPQTNPEVLGLGTYQDIIGSEHDRDVFAFLLEAGQQYSFNLSGTTDQFDNPLLTLFSASGARVASIGRGVENANSAQLFFTPQSNDLYYVSASGAGDAVGTYELSAALVASNGGVQLEDVVPGGVETSFVVEVGDTVSGVINGLEDLDWYRVELEEGKTYRFEMFGEGDPAFNLRGPGVNPAFYLNNDDASPFTNDALIDFSVTLGGTYFISAQSALSIFDDRTANDLYSYTIAVNEIEATAADDFAFGPSFRPGSNVDPDTEIPVYGSIETFGDLDWMSAVIGPDKIYRVTVEGVGDTPLVDPVLKVSWRPGLIDASVIDDDGGIGLNSMLEFTLDDISGIDHANTDIVYFEVSAFGGAGVGDYVVAIEQIGSVDFDDIPGFMNTQETLIVGGSVSSRIDSETDEDWFAMEVVPGVMYRLDVTQGVDSTGEKIAELSVYDAEGRLLAVDDGYGESGDSVDLDNVIIFEAPADGSGSSSSGAGLVYVAMAADYWTDVVTTDYTIVGTQIESATSSILL